MNGMMILGNYDDKARINTDTEGHVVLCIAVHMYKHSNTLPITIKLHHGINKYKCISNLYLMSINKLYNKYSVMYRVRL